MLVYLFRIIVDKDNISSDPVSPQRRAMYVDEFRVVGFSLTWQEEWLGVKALLRVKPHVELLREIRRWMLRKFRLAMLLHVSLCVESSWAKGNPRLALFKEK